MTEDPLIRQIGENVDQLIGLDVMSYGVIGPLMRAARAQAGDRPVALAAAMRLREALAPGATALLTTGLILPGHHPYGETDGPIGTAVLARALALGLGVRVVVATEAELEPLMRALLRTAELQVVPAEAIANENGTHRPVAATVALSRDPQKAGQQAERWLPAFDVWAVVAIEKAGANRHGIYHMVGGQDISDGTSKGVPLFAAARRRGVLTIGIGDRGNELGMGPIAETIRALLPKGQACGCPCGGGVSDETPADIAVPAVVSNWGAYGIAACLAALLEKPELIQSADLEAALFETARREGGVDGMSGRATLSADGVGLPVNIGIARLLAEIYRAQSARDPSPFSTPLIRAAKSGPKAAHDREERP